MSSRILKDDDSVSKLPRFSCLLGSLLVCDKIILYLRLLYVKVLFLYWYRNGQVKFINILNTWVCLVLGEQMFYVLQPSVRKTHCSGRKHKENVKDYYQKWMEEQAQSLIDKTSKSYQCNGCFTYLFI